MRGGQRPVEIAEQFRELFREIVAIRCRTSKRRRSQLIRTGRSADTEIDTARMERFEHAKLFRNNQRRMVRQHHAARTNPDLRADTRKMSDEDRGRGAGDAAHAVMFRDPVPVVTEAFDVADEIE